MDWVMIVLILTTAPNYSQSHSHYLVNFTSEKLALTRRLHLRMTWAGRRKTDLKSKCVLLVSSGRRRALEEMNREEVVVVRPAS